MEELDSPWELHVNTFLLPCKTRDPCPVSPLKAPLPHSPPPPPLPPPPAPQGMMEMRSIHQEGTPIGHPVLASGPNFICITAKSPTGSTEFVLPELSTIQQFKKDLAKQFSCETGQLVLVFFGRILRDQDTLQQCGISNGSTVHLVIRPLKRDPEDPPQLSYLNGTPAPASTSTSLTLPAFNPRPHGFWGETEATPPSPEWQQMPTSEKIVQKVRQVILANPEIQQLAQQFPAICHILNNMGIMRVFLDKVREIMDLARNPEAVQELKNPEQPLLGTQSNTPGGDNPLRQLGSDGQEPGQDLLGPPSPYATLGSSPCLEHAAKGGQGPSMGSSEQASFCHPSASVCTTSSCADEGGAFNSLASPLGHSNCTANLVPSSSAGARAGLGNVGGIQALIVDLCNAYTKRIMFSLMWNALLAAEGKQMTRQEHVQQLLLHFSQQMQRPEMVAAMSNPQAIQAWVQMEQGLQTLVAEAPVLIPWFMLRLKGLGYSAREGPADNGPPTPEE